MHFHRCFSVYYFVREKIESNFWASKLDFNKLFRKAGVMSLLAAALVDSCITICHPVKDLMKAVLISIILLCTQVGFAASVMQLAAFPPPNNKLNVSCRKAQTLQFSSAVYGAEISDSQGYQPILRTETMVGRTKEWATTAYKVFQKWVAVHRYTTADKISSLMALDQSLSPARTNYFLFESGADQVAIRMFDGSQQVSHHGKVWEEGSLTDRRVPLERQDPGLELPERKRPNHQIVELGLLESTKNVSQGMRWAFSQIARAIDAKFNLLEYTTFGRSIIPKIRGLKIYAQTRPEQVEMFARFGLLPVLNTDGTPKKLKSGLILLAADPEVFLQKNFSLDTNPRLKTEADQEWVHVKLQEVHHLRIAHNLEVERKSVDLSTPQELVDIAQSMQRLLSSASRETPYSDAQQGKLALFFETYLRVNSYMPPHLQNKNWQTVRFSILHAMSQANPFAAYLMYYHFMNGRARGSDLNEQAEAKFFLKMPVLEHIPFGSIVDSKSFNPW